MRDFLYQIREGLVHNLYFLSLFAALAIPSICGALESDDGIDSRIKYINWFNRYAAREYSNYLTGEDCYNFRCSILHQGSTQHPNSNYSRILFVEPQATNCIFHCNILNDALNIDVRIFCNDLLNAAEAWLNQVEGTKNYQRNYDRFIRRYPNGLPPYIGGVPVIS